MPWDPYSHVWVDPTTGVPDMMMPPGMQGPGPPVSQPLFPSSQQRPPMQMGAPSPAFTPSPQQSPPITPAGPTPGSVRYLGGLAKPGIPDPLSQEQITGGFEDLSRPSPWSAGKIASTVLTSPLKAVAGLVGELQGALGIPTVEDAAAKWRAIYGQADKSESRAFGVPVAEDPDFGDRFMGIFDGSARRTEQAGIAMRQIVGANKQAYKDALSTHKIIQGLDVGEQNLQKGDVELEFLRREKEAGLRSSNSSAYLAELRASELEQRRAAEQKFFGQYRADPEGLVRDPRAYAEAASGRPDLMKQGLEASRSFIEQPDPMQHAMTPEEIQAAEVAATKVEDDRRIARLADTIALVESTIESRMPTADEIKKGTTLKHWWEGTQGPEDTRTQLTQLRTTILGYLAEDPPKLTQDQAIRVAGGLEPLSKYVPAEGAVDAPLANATPVPRASPGLVGSSARTLEETLPTMGPDARAAERARRASPPGARDVPIEDDVRYKGEDARRKNSESVALFDSKFRPEWTRKRPRDPVDGPEYKRILKREAAKKGLKIEE